MTNIILIKHKKGHYHFTKPVSHLLHLVSDVDLSFIEDVKIYSRSLMRYMPWYPSSKGGGAITLGNKKWKSITFTENFFSTDQINFKGRAYGDQLHIWLKLAAHEVGHLEHAQRFGSLFIYLWIFIYQYLLYGHDKAPLEIEADRGSRNYNAFNNFINNKYGKGELSELINNKAPEEIKIETLNYWWSVFKTQTSASIA